MKKIILSLYLFLPLFGSCGRLQTLNLRPHLYSERPKHIVWIQIAGFSEEYLPLLKYSKVESLNQMSFENMSCLGKMWNYNLYQLRPSPADSLWAQAYGTKNVTDDCGFIEKKSILNLMMERNYTTSVVESGIPEKNSFLRNLTCSKNSSEEFKKLRLYRLGNEKSEEKYQLKDFHFQYSTMELKQLSTPGLYRDKSCKEMNCFSSLSNNFKSLWTPLYKDQLQTFLLLKDFNFFSALKKYDMKSAKETLEEVDKIISWINQISNGNALVLVTGGAPLQVEFPKEGQDWNDFIKNGKNFLLKQSTLMSPVFSFGPMAENFCGVFEESELINRILYKPEEKVFSWDLLNPF